MNIDLLPSCFHIDPETDASYLFVSNINDAAHNAHRHEFFEIMLVVEGKALHFVNETKQVISEGYLIFIRPEDVHYFEMIDNYQCQFINVPFSKATFKDLCIYLSEGFQSEGLLQLPLPPYVELSSIEKNILRQRFEALNLIPVTNKKIMKLKLRALLVDILTNYITATLPVSQNHIPQWFQELCLSMNTKANFTEGIEALKRLSGKSHEHLCRLFKKYYGTTPIDFINDLKLNYCANLLINTDLSILDISIDVGFYSLSHFYSIFKLKFGTSPANFKKLNNKVGSII